MNKTISLFVCLFLFIASLQAIAETKTFLREWTHIAGDEDSKNSSRAIAFEQVKRLLAEELGTYIESYTEVKNSQLTKDQIISFTAAIIQTKPIDESWDGKKFWLKAEMKADPDEVAKNIENLSKDKKLKKELEDSRRKASDALAEVEKLRKELQKSKSDEQSKRYNEAIQRLSATDLYEQGIRYSNRKKLNEAIDAFTVAIKVNPNYYEAYLLRGINYGKKGKHDLAIEDFIKAITINPNEPDAYLGRGLVYVYAYKYDLAIMDFNKAIEIDPDYYDAYRYRGDLYFYKHDYDKAIEDFDKAVAVNPGAIIKSMSDSIAKNPKNFISYYIRGIARDKIGDMERASLDFSEATKIDTYNANKAFTALQKKYPNSYAIYCGRAWASGLNGLHDDAIKDFSRAIKINPNLSMAYFGRGLSYEFLHNPDAAIRDYIAACQLKDVVACKKVKSLKQTDKSVEEIRQSGKFEENIKSIEWLNRGIENVNAGNYEKATEAFTKAIELDAKNAKAYYYRGRAYEKLGMRQEATDDKKMAIKLDSKSALDWMMKDGTN